MKLFSLFLEATPEAPNAPEGLLGSNRDIESRANETRDEVLGVTLRFNRSLQEVISYLETVPGENIDLIIEQLMVLDKSFKEDGEYFGVIEAARMAKQKE